MLLTCMQLNYQRKDNCSLKILLSYDFYHIEGPSVLWLNSICPKKGIMTDVITAYRQTPISVGPIFCRRVRDLHTFPQYELTDTLTHVVIYLFSVAFD